MQNYLFEIYLKSIEVLVNGKKGNKTASNFLSSNLIYPKEEIPSIESIKELSLKDGEEETEFENLLLPERLLFKSTIQGNSFISFNLTAKVKPNKVDKIIKNALQLGFIAGADALTSGFGKLFLAGVSKSITTSIFDLAETKDKITSIGTGFFEFNNATKEDNYIIDLNLTNDISTKRYSRSIRNYVDIPLKKGKTNGKVTITVKKIPLIPVA